MSRRLRRRGGRDTSRLVGPALFTPSLRLAADHVQVGGMYSATLLVSGYPHEVATGWLEPLLAYPGRLDVAWHLQPTPAAVGAARLRRQRGRLESGRRLAAAAGRLNDPDVDAAADDAADLAGRLARGEARLFTTGLYLTVHADSKGELAEEVERVTALAHSLLLGVHPARYRMLAGWATTLPLAEDLLRATRAMDTAAVAAAFPFTSADVALPDPRRPGAAPVVYGPNLGSTGIVAHDRWAQANYNSVALATSGAGKSYLAKLDVLRSATQGIDVHVIDPEDEYGPLAAALGGTQLSLGAPGVRLNPLDLPVHGRGDPELLTRRMLFAHTFLTTLAGAPAEDPAVRAALDRALLAAYAHAGITTDPATWDQPPPLLADVTTALHADPHGQQLAGLLAPFVTGSHRGLFEGATTAPPTGHLVVYSLRALPEELRAAGTLLVLDAIWRQVADPTRRRRRLVVVDEAWLLMAHPAGARFLVRLAKAARKWWAGLALITQDSGDLLGTDEGRAILANAATKLLLRQDGSAATAVQAACGLSDGETAALLTARPGEALLVAAGRRALFRAQASPHEHRLITTDPVDLARRPTHPATTAAEIGPARPAAHRPRTPADDADPL
ncbi:conjugal transfer protein TraC [Frankia sp. AgPm24]|uniref:VirB4 family type IV secretion system protein n=1 Tax=Frankia sp. AgPm24 TaxID=631128 RepID=UPI00200F629E|nr:conjugal transfer protein TraC [Frankia sp. AgPm24]MCK9921216.1 conjugal transfer protein TraC [Frankia sp. AgPm24]